MTNQQINIIKKHYAPVWLSSGVLDVEKTARRIADWSQEFFGDPAHPEHNYIYDAIPDFHIEVYCDLMSQYRLYYVTCPSESGKTTCVTHIYPMYQVYYFDEPYTVLCGRTGPVTVTFLDIIKEEIEFNPKLNDVYGSYKVDNSRTHTWSDYEIVLKNGSKIEAIAVRGTVRSKKRRQWRITLSIIDDPEDVDDLDSATEMYKNWRWIMRSLEKRLDRRYGKLRLVGTRLGVGCCIEQAIKDTRWEGRSYKALNEDKDGNYYSIWEARLPVTFLVNEKKAAIVNQDLPAWLFERQNEAPESISKNLSGYKIHSLVYRRINDQNTLSEGKPQDEPIPVSIYADADPAFAKTDSADPRAVIVYALGRILKANEIYGDPYWLNCIWVLEYLHNWMSPELIIDALFEYHKKYHLDGVAIEAIGGAQLYESIMVKKLAGDKFFFDNPMNVNFVNWQPQNKLDRIYARLQPKVKYGQFFLRNGHVELMVECDKFNKDKVHLLDALEMGLRVHSVCNKDFNNASPKRRELNRRTRVSYDMLANSNKSNDFSKIGIPRSLNQILPG